ncbi:VC0807 family protein [Kitasatospora cystarginea]|uniref:VC0807 family protein n=1 Tax=Kitasatospora cystarginea TaxID=58350 RepID=UPI0031E16297
MSDQTPARRGGAAALGWVFTIIFNIVAPILTESQLKSHGYPEYTALLASAAWPILGMLISIAWQRKIDEFGIFSLIIVALTLAVTLVGPHSARLLLVKDSAITGLFGLVCLATLAAPRPLMFYFGRKFATDGSRESIDHWNGLWAYEGFRKVQRTMTLVWGLGSIAEAALRIVLSYVLSSGAMVAVNSVLSYGATAALIVWSIAYGKRAHARAAATTAAAATSVAAA